MTKLCDVRWQVGLPYTPIWVIPEVNPFVGELTPIWVIPEVNPFVGELTPLISKTGTDIDEKVTFTVEGIRFTKLCEVK